jgi:ligand-binding sensor domain-containing protein/class 3 adenylate cyclase
MKYLFILSGILFLAVSCNNWNEQNQPETTTAARQDTLAPPHRTVIANLPDSLQPKTVALDKAPKPITIDIPKTTGRSYSVTASKGAIQKINLEPAVTKMLPFMRNEKGEAVKDKDGNPFIMGDGGISSFKNFTTDDGLALDIVNCSLIDKSGNLWFGTQGGGVSRYDGKSFTTFSTAQGLGDNTVSSIIEDKSGNLWFSTMGKGVSRYDGKSFTTFSTAHGLANNYVYSIAEDKSGNLWFGTRYGEISRYDGKSLPAGQASFTTFTSTRAQGLPRCSVMTIFEDRSGNLWFGTYSGGVLRYDGKSLPAGQASFTVFSTAQGLANNHVFAITEDKSGNLWFGTYGGVSRYDGKTFTTFTIDQGLANNTVVCIAEDQSGNIWFGTDGGGVSRYDGKSLPAGQASFNTFTTDQGLANNAVLSITEDKSGNLWFGTSGGGVSRYNGKSFTTFSTAQGLPDHSIFGIAEDKSGNLWFGTRTGGISRYDGKSFTTFSSAQGLPNNHIHSIGMDKTGNLWVGIGGGGVSRYDGKSLPAGQASFTTFYTPQGLPNYRIISIEEDRSGNLWFGTSGGGVLRYDGKSFTAFTTTQGLASNKVWSIVEDRSGNLWFGTDGEGVSRYDGKSFTTFSIAQGLPKCSVFSIAEDKSGNLWFGTSEGLIFLNRDEVMKTSEINDKLNSRDNIKKRIFKTFTTKDGLPDNYITQVLLMPNGKMAVGSNLGITFFNPAPEPSDNFTSLSGIEIYNTATGYPVKDVNTGSMYIDSKGIIWAGTGSEKTALVRFDPSALHTDNISPTLVIQSIKVNEKNICWYDLSRQSAVDSIRPVDGGKNLFGAVTPANVTEEVTTLGKALTEAERDSMRLRFGDIRFDGITKYYPIPENLVLPYRHNNITIEFGAIEVGRPNMVSYQYILEGYDKEWSPLQKKTSASFGNIHEGSYTFKVKARGPNGVWCDPVTYAFKVLPPWYRAWWAYLLYTLLFLLASGLLIKGRERALRARQKVLEQKVEERTEQLKTEKEKSDDLLLNILPAEVAEELKQTGRCQAKTFSMVTVMFMDFKDFTAVSERVSAELLVDEINACFSAFDGIIEKFKIEKIKTVGDAYICAGGLPSLNLTHALNVVNAAIEIQNLMLNRKKEKEAIGEFTFDMRVGINTGPVVAGIVGVKKFQYDIWGDTVNLAARMEQNSEAGKINISGSTYMLVKDKFNCVYRGKIETKNKGEVEMYFVDSVK